MKIGVFDSGIGGLSVVKAVEAALPAAEVIFKTDIEHFPYATKSPAELYGYVQPIFQELTNLGCETIVVACNTVSTTLITRLREQSVVPLIALEPMVKPAAELTKTKVIAVCATPTTLSSERYAWLKQRYAAAVEVIEPDCSEWSSLIEHNQINDDKIRAGIEPTLQAGADIIVLGCTHYHWIEEQIKSIAAGQAKILQPETAVVAQLKRVLGVA